MGFVTVAHRISADDLASVGAGQYLTGHRIHDAVRSRFGIAPAAVPPNAEGPVWRVRDRYLRTLAPVVAGDDVAILASLDDAGTTAVRVCVRVIGSSGIALACGFETVDCLSPAGERKPLPAAVREQLATHGEPLAGVGDTPFIARVLSDDAAGPVLFPDDTRALGAREAAQQSSAASAPARASVVGKAAPRSSVLFRASAMRHSIGAIAQQPGQAGGPVDARRTGERAAPRATRHSGLLGPLPEFVEPVVGERGVAFVFPGEEAYDGQLLRELHAALPLLDEHFHEADIVARRHFRAGFLLLVDADSLVAHDEHLRRYPQLSQLGVFLTGVLFAEALQERGVRPDVLIGRGLGEITALTVAGAIDLPTGLQIVAQRASMLERARDDAAAQSAAATQFEQSLGKFAYHSPRLQVYSPSQGALYAADAVLPRVLASQLFREPDLAAAVRALRRAGCEYYVECGAGGMTRLVADTLGGKPTTVSTPPGPRRNLHRKLAEVVSAVVRRPAAPLPMRTQQADRKASDAGESASLSPVAITGVGCVLPGAHDPDRLWRCVLDGTSGIAEYEPFTTEAWEPATLAERGNVIASGSLDDVAHDAALPITAEEFEQLTLAQRILALAVAQCVSPLRARIAKARRVRCILGASAEGLREFEERSLVERLRARLATIDEPQALRDQVAAAFGEPATPAGIDAGERSPCRGLASIIERVAGRPVEVMLVDAACASSLYAIDLGMKLLRTMQSDLVIVGGIFTLGASWQPLYSLFEGLIGSGPFPFDGRADGVVFGDGVALLALERLPDAMATAGRRYGVIRGVGLSCDGKKASVSEPNAAGQALAMRRAYANAGVSPRSVQLIEGHGISDPATDAAEIQALQAVFGDAPGTLSPRVLQSVKTIVGHGVWSAGAASVVKALRALEEHVVPPQHGFSVPNPGAQLEGSGFTVPTSGRAWPPNVDGEPRRAGVSAFGLGGTNAHAVVEAYSPVYHAALAARIRPELPRAPMAIAAVARVTAGDVAAALAGTPGAPIAELRAEVRDQLDRSHLLAIAGVEQVLTRLTSWQDCRERTGVVAGMVGRTARAQAAAEWIYRAELRRVLTTHQAELGMERAEGDRIARTLHEMIGDATTPATAHTLMGILPNIAAARVAGLFGLQGPNLMIDADGRSILEVLATAERWLTSGTADHMLVCLLGVRASVGDHSAGDRADDGGEALVLSLTTPTFARTQQWSVVGELVVGARDEESVLVRLGHSPVARKDQEVTVSDSHGLAGFADLARALDAIARGDATLLRWGRDEPATPTPSMRATTALRGVVR